jgi:hypothetical protein
MCSRRFFFTLIFLVGAFSAVQAETDGILTVKTDPEGIKIWVDDKYIGDSPLIDKKLKPGRYSVKLVDPVQQTSSMEEVLIQSGETTVIEKTVKSNYGSLKVTTDPEGAEVSVLTELGKSPVSNDFMIPGKYRLEIKHPNQKYAKLVSDIVIPRGEIVTINKAIEIQKKDIHIGRIITRLAFGVGAIGGYFFAVYEREDPNFGGTNGSVTGQMIGLVVGTLCVIGFEIVAFF